MDRDFAMQLAANQCAGKSTAEFMTTANSIYSANGGTTRRPFNDCDIVVAKLGDFLAEKCTKRERDLVFISDQLPRLWQTFHIGIAVMGEHVREQDLSTASRLLIALKTLGQEQLFTEDLRPDLLKLVEDAAAQASKKPRKKLVYFDWMGAYWSISEEGWATLNERVAKDLSFDMNEIGAKELRSRPRGLIQQFRDVERRTTEY
jgi:hypothetical protein